MMRLARYLNVGRIFTVIIKTAAIPTRYLLEKTILSGLLWQLKVILDDIGLRTNFNELERTLHGICLIKIIFLHPIYL
jgi:hypothetical protein